MDLTDTLPTNLKLCLFLHGDVAFDEGQAYNLPSGHGVSFTYSVTVTCWIDGSLSVPNEIYSPSVMLIPLGIKWL